MKKIFIVLILFLAFGFIFCIGAGFLFPVGLELPQKTIAHYKILNGLTYFLNFMPSLICTGFVVSCSVYFGHNSEGSATRFSAAMFNRFKLVLIACIIISFVFTLFNEAGTLFIQRRKTYLINQPKIVNQYIHVGTNLLENDYPQRAALYADAALKLDQNNKEALALKDKCEEYINKLETTNLRFEQHKAKLKIEGNPNRLVINADEISRSYEYYLKAQESYNNKQWFNAHYYAQQAIKLSNPKDPNIIELKQIATKAWNNISEYRKIEKDAAQKIFEKKYEGYLALLEKDDLKAYYIFNELSLTSRELSIDPDVVFYLNIAEHRVKDKYFFIDETFEISTFENANDICFTKEYADGSKDFFYYKGVTAVKSTGNSLQYLRNLNIISLNPDGTFNKKMSVPYAKVLPVALEDLDEETCAAMNLKKSTRFIPYVQLTSISRTNSNDIVRPTWDFADDSSKPSDYLLLAIPFEDFCMLQNNFDSLETAGLISLLNFVPKAHLYGYSERISASCLLNRLFFPLFIIIIFIIYAAFAWNNMIIPTQFFKLSYVAAFPFFLIIGAISYNIYYFMYKLINFILLAVTSSFAQGLIMAVVVYTFFLILSVLFFLSRKARL